MDYLTKHGAVFLLGSLGALLPEVLKLYAARSRPRKKPFPFSYYLISLVYASVGGVFAVVLPATSHLAAIYIGASWPVMLGNALHHARSRKPVELQARNMANQKPTMEFLPVEKKRPFRALFELVRNQAELLF